MINLADYIVPVVLGICLIIGWLIKHCTPLDNKYIPAICAILGVIINLWSNGWVVTPANILVGLVSGLASVGCHQLINQFLKDGGGVYDDDIVEDGEADE